MCITAQVTRMQSEQPSRTDEHVRDDLDGNIHVCFISYNDMHICPFFIQFERLITTFMEYRDHKGS